MSRLHINSFKVEAILPFDWSNLGMAAAAAVAGGQEGTVGSAVYTFASLYNHRFAWHRCWRLGYSACAAVLSLRRLVMKQPCPLANGWRVACLPCACSCCPNVQVSHPYNDATAVFMAARDIEAGEQLTITYINAEQPVRTRQEELWFGYGFRCGCEACHEQ
jgi:hypothetical protein